MLLSLSAVPITFFQTSNTEKPSCALIQCNSCYKTPRQQCWCYLTWRSNGTGVNYLKYFANLKYFATIWNRRLFRSQCFKGSLWFSVAYIVQWSEFNLLNSTTPFSLISTPFLRIEAIVTQSLSWSLSI